MYVHVCIIFTVCINSLVNNQTWLANLQSTPIMQYGAHTCHTTHKRNTVCSDLVLCVNTRIPQHHNTAAKFLILPHIYLFFKSASVLASSPGRQLKFGGTAVSPLHERSEV